MAAYALRRQRLDGGDFSAQCTGVSDEPMITASCVLHRSTVSCPAAASSPPPSIGGQLPASFVSLGIPFSTSSYPPQEEELILREEFYAQMSTDGGGGGPSGGLGIPHRMWIALKLRPSCVLHASTFRRASSSTSLIFAVGCHFAPFTITSSFSF